MPQGSLLACILWMLLHRVPWQIDGKTTAHAGSVLHSQTALVCLNPAPGNGQSQAQAPLVFASLGKRHKHVFGIAPWQPATMVCDIDQNAITGAVGSQGHFGPRVRKLESVLQQVSDRCREQM